MAAITPFLMFTGQAEEAMTFYVSLFPGSKMDSIVRYGPEGPGAEGTVMQAAFTLDGRQFRCIDSPPVHAFGFTPSISMFVECEDAAAVDRLFAALSDGGQALMPVGEYPFSPRYGWVNDRFGVSWQISQKA